VRANFTRIERTCLPLEEIEARDGDGFWPFIGKNFIVLCGISSESMRTAVLVVV
jgi:hypothetical protein